MSLTEMVHRKKAGPHIDMKLVVWGWIECMKWVLRQARLLITVFQHYCFQCQIHSIPGYCSTPQYSCSNLFKLSSCWGSKNRYCFQREDSNIYYCFHRNYCVTVFLSIGQYSTVFLSITVYVRRNSVWFRGAPKFGGRANKIGTCNMLHPRHFCDF